MEALAEVLLTNEPQQGDVLLIRKRLPNDPMVPGPRTLKPLWPLVQREALIEYKSPSRPPRRGDLAKLIGYGGQLHCMRNSEIGSFANLLLCFVITEMNSVLREELEDFGGTAHSIAPGYLLFERRPYPLLVVDLSEVAADGDEWMSIFVPQTQLTVEAKQWLEENMIQKDMAEKENLEGHDELLARLLNSLSPEEILRATGPARLLSGMSAEQRLAGLPPEQRLAGLPPEQRLAGLPPEQRWNLMPVEALRALPQEYVRTLSASIQGLIRARIEKTSK